MATLIIVYTKVKVCTVIWLVHAKTINLTQIYKEISSMYGQEVIFKITIKSSHVYNVYEHGKANQLSLNL